MNTTFKLGVNAIEAVIHQKGNAVPTMLNVHHDEETSVAAGKTNIAEFGGRLIELVHPGQRLIMFKIAGISYSFDPNRIFSDEGIRATLDKHSIYSPEAHAEIKRFAHEYLNSFALDREPIIIALHNTVDGIFSVESFTPAGKLAAEATMTHVSPRRSKFDFFYVTAKNFFEGLKSRDFNVVLQNNDNVTDDGSLSVHFARLGIPYINVEAEMSHLKTQIEMLAAMREMLRELEFEK